MNAITIVKLVLIGGVVLTVLSIGLRARPADALALLRKPALAARAMLSMFVVMPILVVAAAYFLPMDAPARAALIALSVSPAPPILPQRQAKVGAESDYAVGLQVMAVIVSLIAAPIVVWIAGRLFGVTVVFGAGAVVKVLSLTVAAPLAAGIGVALLWPRAIAFSALIARIGMVLLAVGAVIVLFAVGPAIIARIGDGLVLTIAAIVLVGLLVGHLLGGPNSGNRGALAMATAARHPGVAIALAAASFPRDQKAIAATVLLFLLVNLVVTLPYVIWRGRVARHAERTATVH